MIEPFFFHGGKIFGCYHPPGNSISSRLVVICPPFFDEYRRSYKALALLAGTCAGQGMHALRFDYVGTGDSFGNLGDVTADDWKENIETAIEEGIDVSGSEEVVLCGVRFGGTIAAQIRHPKIKRYVFWDPLLDGSEYLRWLDDINQSWKNRHITHALSYNIPIESIEYENFHLTQRLRESIKKVAFRQPDLSESGDSYIISTHGSFSTSGKCLNCEFVGPEYDWPAYHDGILIQKPVLAAIARRVLEP